MLTFTRRRQRENAALEQETSTQIENAVMVEESTSQKEAEVVNEPSQIHAPQGQTKRRK